MRDAGDAFGEGVENGGGAAHGVVLERSTSGKHEDDDRGDEIFTQQDGGDDREAGEEVRSEVECDQFPEEIDKEGDASGGKDDPEGEGMAGEKVDRDAGSGAKGDIGFPGEAVCGRSADGWGHWEYP